MNLCCQKMIRKNQICGIYLIVGNVDFTEGYVQGGDIMYGWTEKQTADEYLLTILNTHPVKLLPISWFVDIEGVVWSRWVDTS